MLSTEMIITNTLYTEILTNFSLGEPSLVSLFKPHNEIKKSMSIKRPNTSSKFDKK